MASHEKTPRFLSENSVKTVYVPQRSFSNAAGFARNPNGKVRRWRASPALQDSQDLLPLLRFQKRPLTKLFESLTEFFLRIHHNGAVPRHGLFEWLP